MTRIIPTINVFSFREQALEYVANPTTWDSRRGLKRSWHGNPKAGSSSSTGATSSPKPSRKPTSAEKGIDNFPELK